MNLLSRSLTRDSNTMAWTSGCDPMGGRLQPSKYPLQSPQIDCLWDRLYLFPADRKHRPITKQPLILDFLHVHFLSFFIFLCLVQLYTRRRIKSLNNIFICSQVVKTRREFVAKTALESDLWHHWPHPCSGDNLKKHRQLRVWSCVIEI